MLITLSIKAQSTNTCPFIRNSIKIENTEDIPAVETNDDGTLMLTFEDVDITNIFSNYSIYEFYQTFPTGSQNAQKYYTLNSNSYDLGNEIASVVDANIMTVSYVFETSPLSQNIIDVFSNKVLTYTKYCSDIPEANESCNNNEMQVPPDFSLVLETHYDEVNDVIVMQSQGLTPCENTIEIGFKAGVDSADNLFLWNATAGSVNTEIENTASCNYAETFLMDMFGIGCFENSHYGDLFFQVNNEDGTIRFQRETTIFSSDISTFTFSSLGVDDFQPLENLKLVKLNDNQAKLIDLKTLDYELTMYDLSGKVLKKSYIDNSNLIDISRLSKGLYLFKITLPNKESKVIKFLK